MEINRRKFKLRRDLKKTIKQQPSEEVVCGLYAQLFLEHCLLNFKKRELERQMDLALDQYDKDRFLNLSHEYNLLYHQNKLGLTLVEQDYKFHVYLKW